MMVKETAIPGAYIITNTPFVDERGSFSRIFCKREFEAIGLSVSVAQISLSTNAMKGTLRGLHFQKNDSAEDKLIACVSGSVFDVCVDVREYSPTFGKWVGETLSSENGVAIYVPKGCAHGYLTLQDDCKLTYFVTEFYQPGEASGYMYNDPFFSIEWPIKEPYIISKQDSCWGYIDNNFKGASSYGQHEL